MKAYRFKHRAESNSNSSNRIDECFRGCGKSMKEIKGSFVVMGKYDGYRNCDKVFLVLTEAEYYRGRITDKGLVIYFEKYESCTVTGDIEEDVWDELDIPS